MAKLNLVVTLRINDFHVCLEGHTEIWACGKTLDEAVGDWVRTHYEHHNIEIDYSALTTDITEKILEERPHQELM